MNGEINNVPMYNPVAFNPFSVEETPSFSKMTEISGNSIPCENPEIETIAIKVQNLRCSYFSVVNMLALQHISSQICDTMLTYQVENSFKIFQIKNPSDIKSNVR